MKAPKKYFVFLIVFLLGILYWRSIPVNAERVLIQPSPALDVTDYLAGRLKELNVPVTYIKIIQNAPMEIEIGIQSLSLDDKFSPDDFYNIHLVVREAVLSHEAGYQINALTRVVYNQHGETIDWGWIKIEPENMYTRIQPIQTSDNVAEDLMSEKLSVYEMRNLNIDAVSLGEYQMLDMDSESVSIDELNRTTPGFIKSLPALVADINSQGAAIVIVKYKVLDEKNTVLLNYMYDSQFMTAGWWAAEDVNAENWMPSAPPAEEGN